MTVSPSRRVEVLYRGRWLRGWLSAWRTDDVRWLGYVTFSHPDGVTQPKWFVQDDLRRLGGLDASPSLVSTH